MLRKYVMTAALAGFCATGLAAQTPATGSDQQNPTTQSEPRPTQSEPSTTAPASQASSAASTTMTGCVYREQDVPGRTPNVAERAGVMEDYILVKADGAQASSGAAAETQSAAGATTPQATGTSGSAHTMFKLEHASDEQLRAMVGKRVEVKGRVDAEAGDSTARPTGTSGAATGADKSAGPDRIDLAEFEVTSIREVEGTCPASPSVR